MRLSCLPVSFFDALSRGEMSLPEWLDFAAELGLDGVECSPVLIEPIGLATVAEFRKLAEARGLAISNFTSYSDFTQPDPAQREREVVAMIANVQIARELGTSTVRMLTGQRRPGVEQPQGVAWVVESARRVAEEADRLAMKVVIENHTKAFVWTDFDFAMQGEVLLSILDGLKDTSIGVQFDTANPIVSGEDTLSLFERLKDRIAYVHLNDQKRPGVFEFVPVGSGIAPNREVLARLRRLGYEGWVGIEEASRTGRRGFQEAVEFARDAMRTEN